MGNVTPITKMSAVKPRPSGSTAARARNAELIEANARMATLVRRRILVGFIRQMRENAHYVPTLTPDLLRLLRDTEDRGFGAPNQSVNVNSTVTNREMTIDPEKMTTQTLQELVQAMDAEFLAPETAQEYAERGAPEDEDFPADDEDIEDPALYDE